MKVNTFKSFINIYIYTSNLDYFRKKAEFDFNDKENEYGKLAKMKSNKYNFPPINTIKLLLLNIITEYLKNTNTGNASDVKIGIVNSSESSSALQTPTEHH